MSIISDMENIILSLEPAFHRVERYLLWQNRYASILAFTLGHGIFYAIARAGLRPFCAMTIVLFILHLLDCIKKKRMYDEEKNCSQLTQLVLQSYRNVCQTQDKLQTIKTENRVKYSLIIILICLLLAYIGMKINGFYVSYLVMLVLFTLPAIKYHKILPKVLKRLAPLLEQLDESMEYKRRTLIDRKDLLVKIKTPGLNEFDDDDEKFEQINADDENPTNLKESGFDIPNDVYANVGRQRIKIKGDEVKIKGHSKIIDRNFFQTNNLSNTSGTEPDLTSFDFLNEYEE